MIYKSADDLDKNCIYLGGYTNYKKHPFLTYNLKKVEQYLKFVEEDCYPKTFLKGDMSYKGVQVFTIQIDEYIYKYEIWFSKRVYITIYKEKNETN